MAAVPTGGGDLTISCESRTDTVNAIRKVVHDCGTFTNHGDLALRVLLFLVTASLCDQVAVMRYFIGLNLGQQLLMEVLESVPIEHDEDEDKLEFRKPTHLTPTRQLRKRLECSQSPRTLRTKKIPARRRNCSQRGRVRLKRHHLEAMPGWRFLKTSSRRKSTFSDASIVDAPRRQ